MSNLYHFPTTSNLCYLVQSDGVLLIMKKRGFGAGKLNGVGGKLNPGETSEEAVRREIKEEIGCEPVELKSVGVIEFVWPEDKKDWNQRCQIYICSKFSGEPIESEECLPRWYKISQLPLDQMWDDDQYWLSGVLAGGTVNKRFFFDDESKVLRFEDI